MDRPLASLCSLLSELAIDSLYFILYICGLPIQTACVQCGYSLSIIVTDIRLSDE